MLAAQGVKEFVLISQDTTTYGSDLALKDGLARLGRFDCRGARRRVGAFSLLLSDGNHR